MPDIERTPDDENEDDIGWGNHVETPHLFGKLEPLESLNRDDKQKLTEKIIEINGDIRLSNEESHQFLKEKLEEVLNTLTPKQQRIIQLRFGLEDGQIRTPEEIAKEFKVTTKKIEKIEAQALRILRHPSRSRMLKDY